MIQITKLLNYKIANSLAVLYVILFLTFIIPTIVNAQAGTLDFTFNNTDVGYGSCDGPNFDINATAIQSDGKIFIVGSFTTYNGVLRNRIARLNADGSIDLSFNPGIGANGSVNCIIILSDGKIIIGGAFTSYNGNSCNRIARINSDGSFDLTFNTGTGSSSNINSIAIQSDGKIIIGGLFTSFNTYVRNRIARLNIDGSLDTSFGFGSGGASGEINSVAIQSDGNILIGGNFTSFNGTARNRIARLDILGNLDSTFIVGTGFNSTVNAVAIRSDGKIIVGGNFSTYNGVTKPRLASILTNGSLDVTFNASGTGASTSVKCLTIQSDDKILIGGAFTAYNGITRNNIARLFSDGSLDASFDTFDGPDNQVLSISIKSDDSIILGGSFTSFNLYGINKISRLFSDGSIDLNFNIGTGAKGTVKCSAVQSDGKIIIGGTFVQYNGVTRNRIARLNPDGSLDNTFNPFIGANNDVNSISIQSDGKIIIAGRFTSINGIPKNRIARLNADGSFDATFVLSGVNSDVNATTIQPDGKIIIVGDFSTFNGVTRPNVIRLHADGSFDTSFSPASSSSGPFLTVALQSDGKIIVGGGMTTVKGFTRNKIARLNTNGSLDMTFNPILGANFDINSIAIKNDGKIIIGGEFTSYNGNPCNRIARINSDGSFDATFSDGSGVDNDIICLRIQNDNKIVIGGLFSTRIAVLNSTGDIDGTFNPGLSANDKISTISLQADNKIIIGGDFTSYNGTGRNRVARINGPVSEVISTSTLSSNQYCSGEMISVPYSLTGIFNSGNVFTVQLSDATGNFSSATSIGTLSSITDGTITAVIPISTISGVGYRVRVVSSNPVVIGSDNGSNLVVNSISSETVSETACDSYTWALNGTTYTSSGTYTHVGTNAAGCQLTTTLNLTINNSTTASVTETACDSYTWALNGTTYTSSGTYTHVGTNTSGCQLTTTLNLTINNSTTASVTETACDSYTWALNGTTYTSSGTYTHVGTNAAGCQLTTTLNLTINNSTTASVTETACDSYTWALNGTTYTSSGTYTHVGTNAAGCQLTTTLNLTINNSTTASVTETACDSYTWALNGTTYTSSGTYTHVGTNTSGCQLTTTLNLTINNSTTASVTETACDSYTWALNGTTYTSSGTYTHVGTNAAGCQLTTTLNLTINNSTTASVTETACDSYTWALNGTTYTSSGTYTHVGTNAAGCQLTTTLNLTINNSTTASVTETACDSYTWALNGTTYTSSGTYTHVGTNAAGCQLTTTLNLTINNSTTASVTETACDSYTWALNGTTYTSSGTYTHVGTNTSGCQLTTTLNLTINNSTTASVTETACDSYTWALNGTTYTSSGTYTHVGTNTSGCQLTTTLNLTINNSTTASVTETACDSYTWALNGTTYTSSGTYTHVGTNAAGCQLTTTLNLTINNSTTASVTETACDSYTWALNGTTYTSSGTYTHVGTNAAGCQLTTTLNLTINNSTTASVTETACDSYTWALNGTTYTSSGTYTHVGTNAAGCQLTTTLNLTIGDVTAPVANVATLSNVSSECPVTSITPPTATDNCEGKITGTHNVSLPITTVGTTTITWTYNDGNGNTSSQTQDIIITPIDNGITQVSTTTLNANASGYNYQWVDCNNSNTPVSGATSQTFTPSVAGSYACIIDNGVCSVTTACFSSTLSNVDNYIDNTFSVFPNPVKNKLNISYDNVISKVSIYNLLGQEVLTKIINAKESVIDATNLASGTYMVKVASNNDVKTLKIIKE